MVSKCPWLYQRLYDTPRVGYPFVANNMAQYLVQLDEHPYFRGNDSMMA